MEEKINQKPCVVQKIETPQGFSVSYKEHLLYSKYNPSKNIITAIEKLNLLPGTIILCVSPVFGYGLHELAHKLPENCQIIICEAEPALYDFYKTEGFKTDSQIVCEPAELTNLPIKLYELAKSGKYKRVIRLDMSAGAQFNSDFYIKLISACIDSVMTFWKNRITLTRFGRRYSKNLFENLHYLTNSKPITEYFNCIDKPIIVFGAGESTQTFIDNGLLRRCAPRNDDFPFFILCADTTLQPLLKNGITPDGVFVEEAQSVIVKAFTGTPKSTHIFAGLSSIPNISHRAGAENVSYFFTEYADGTFFDCLKSKNFMPPANKPFGSVGLTAVYYALKFRKDNTIPVYVTGLDFSYSAGITHTKGALAHILRLSTSNRLFSVANYNAAFNYGSEKIQDKTGKTVFTTVTLKSYAAMFNSFFSGIENLFDIGESGIKLEIPHKDIDCFVANAPRDDRESCKNEDTNHCKPDTTRHYETEGRSNPHDNDIKNFLATEHSALEYLRNLLTGKTELKGKALLEEIKKTAAPREYLYLHFADGAQFSTNQSFLNRLRTEIDFFLKYI